MWWWVALATAACGDEPAAATSWLVYEGGSFSMGIPAGAENIPAADPARTVTVGPFALATTEGRVSDYDACVAAGRCAERPTREECHRAPDMPANCVSYRQATSFCQWQGGRLPTEAEWAFAARGPEARLYPWGDASWETRDIGDPFTDHPVGSCPSLSTPEGLHDMAGNVREWTSDGGNGAHVTRSLSCAGIACLAYNRFPGEADDNQHHYNGVRCAREAVATEGERVAVRPQIERPAGPREVHWAMLGDGVHPEPTRQPFPRMPRIVCMVDTVISPEGRATPSSAERGQHYGSECPVALREPAMAAVRAHTFEPSEHGVKTSLPVWFGEPDNPWTDELRQKLPEAAPK